MDSVRLCRRMGHFRATVLLATILVTSSVYEVRGQLREIDISGEGPSADLRLQNDRFVAVYRRAIPVPGPGDQWVVVRDRQWKEIFRAIPGRDIAGSTSFSLSSAAAGPGETLAISGTTWSDRGESASVLALYDMKQDKLQRVIKTSPLVCFQVAVDKAGGIWCLGSDSVKRRMADDTYDVLHRFSPEGNVTNHGISRSSFSTARAPESDSRKGWPQLLLSPSGDVGIWFSGLHTLLLAGSTGQEKKRWITEGLDPTAEPTLAATPDGRVFGLVPTDTASGIQDRRYRLHELRAYKGDEQDGDGAVFQIGDAAAKLRWSLRPETADRHFAGRSNELVGIDETAAVIWDRSAGRLKWLEPLK